YRMPYVPVACHAYSFTGTIPCSMLPSLLPASTVARALPSFPTRRSSDLLAFVQGCLPNATVPLHCSEIKRFPMVNRMQFYIDGRSEEHTSELQSHLNLVCRLLLEKKNQARTPIHERTERGYERKY